MYPVRVLYDGQLAGTAAAGPGSHAPNVVHPHQLLQWGTANHQAPLVDQARPVPALVPYELPNIVQYRPSVPPWLRHNPMHQHAPVRNPVGPSMETGFAHNATHYQWVSQPYQSIENAAIPVAYVPLHHGPTGEAYITPMRPNLHQANIAVPSYPMHLGRTDHSNENIGRFATNRQVNDAVDHLKPQSSHTIAHPSPGRGIHKKDKITQVRPRDGVMIQKKNRPGTQETNPYFGPMKVHQIKLEPDVNQVPANRTISLGPLQNSMTILKSALQDQQARPYNGNESIRTKYLNPRFDNPQWRGRSPCFPNPYLLGYAGADRGPPQNSSCIQVLKTPHRTPPWLSKHLDSNKVNTNYGDHLEDSKKTSTLDVGSKRKLASTDIDKRPTCKVVPTDKIRVVEEPPKIELSTDLSITMEKSPKKCKVEIDECELKTLDRKQNLGEIVFEHETDVKLENEENTNNNRRKVPEVQCKTLIKSKIYIAKPIERLDIIEDTEKSRYVKDETSEINNVKGENIVDDKLNEINDNAIVKENAVGKKTHNNNEDLLVSKTTEDHNKLKILINRNLNDTRTKNIILTHVISGIIIKESKLPFDNKIKYTEPDAATRKYSTQGVKCKDQTVQDSSISKKDSTLTHVIDGLIIQESDSPFQVGKPRWLTKESETIKTKHNGNNDDFKQFLQDNQTLYLTMTESNAEVKSMSKMDKTVLEEEIALKHPLLEKMSEISESLDSHYLKEAKRPSPLDNIAIPLVDMATLESWSCAELQRHLRRRWCECLAALQHDEVDGRALLLARAEQLEAIGVCAPHASALCAFAEGVALVD